MAMVAKREASLLLPRVTAPFYFSQLGSQLLIFTLGSFRTPLVSPHWLVTGSFLEAHAHRWVQQKGHPLLPLASQWRAHVFVYTRINSG